MYWNNYASTAPNLFFWNASGLDASSSPSSTQITGLNGGDLYVLLEGYSTGGSFCANESCNASYPDSLGTVLNTFSVDGHTVSLVKWLGFTPDSRSGLYLANPHMTYQGRIYMTNYTTDDLGSLITDQASLYSYLNFHKTPPLLHEITSDITSSTTWHSGDVYKISGNVVVASGVTLTLDPGAIIKFDSATSSGMTINGILDSNGQDEHSGSPVFITSFNDDIIGGDTNEDGTTTSPQAGDWDGITINSGGVGNFEHTVIRYGGTTTPATTPMLFNDGGTLNIATSTVAYSASDGIKTSAGTTTVSGSDVAFNDYGLYLDGGTISITATSTIHDNTTYGAFTALTATSSFNALNNYWATSTEATTTGPYNEQLNPSGGGDHISQYIAYDPWIGKAGTTTLPHYVIDANCHSDGYCGSIPNGSNTLYVDASTTPYQTETDAAIATWNGQKSGIIATTTSSANVAIYSTTTPDVSWKGKWDPNTSQPNPLFLNQYYLDSNTAAQRQNTITHELGHALGLDHSYTGNIMFLAQSSQTSLGSQDKLDFDLLW